MKHKKPLCNSCASLTVNGQDVFCIKRVKEPLACVQWARAPGGMTAQQRQQYHAAQPKPIQEAITQ